MQNNSRNRIRQRKALKPEDAIYAAIAYHMKVCYPGVIYRFDYGAGVFMGFKAANFQKQIQEGRAFPDLMIYEPVNLKFDVNGVDGKGTATIESKSYCGLAIEVKAEDERIYKKDGVTFTSDHIKEQFEMLERLRTKGWMAHFGIGLPDCIDRIERYLAMTEAKKKTSIRY